MTDSTTDAGSGEEPLEIGPSADELFGAIADGSIDDHVPEREASDGSESADDERETESPDRTDVEDTTAADVFDRLRTEPGSGTGPDAVLADESPEDIIASADDPEPEPDDERAADDLLDEDALEDLLLTDRTEEDGFLWIDADEDDEDDAAATAESATETTAEEPASSEESATADESASKATAADAPDSETAGSSDADASADSDAPVVVTPPVASEAETALTPRPHEGDLATTDDEPDGLLGWLRSKLSSLLS